MIPARTEGGDRLLLELCREAGDTGTDLELIEGARGNHDPRDVEPAASGDVAALLRLRLAMGLAPICNFMPFGYHSPSCRDRDRCEDCSDEVNHG